ncbi:hypothetical protein BGW36DRAFT_284650 [Talaromyces proteolyticus]|uniref:Uncharacterized protein n=1 Tax=Talaromyces proteolyticus TaxID=1131652 RepID=A0AAD4Q6S9_9EURO|nr:uncharacterized protein BGW36DRAFT_284650 [Talaromyces proteolyticus]KAH8705642.1 hypothetical protein BGW36DRAFT_284650 [Talaromyces proteolyticus]
MSLLSHSEISTLHQASKTELTYIRICEKSNDYQIDPSTLLYPGETDENGRPLIPAPSLFTDLYSKIEEDSSSPKQDLPTVGQCATHLELLEVFFALRGKIVNSETLDDTFGVKVVNNIVYRKKYDTKKRKYIYAPVRLRDTTFKDRRREKWSYYLSIAVERFKTWIRKADEAALDRKDLLPSSTEVVLPCLPPIDVLMVWHAFLLNPLSFDYYCRRHKLKVIRQVKFPWAQIHSAIDSNDCTYNLPGESKDWTIQVANMEPDLYQYLEVVRIVSRPIYRALTKYGDKNVPIGSLWDYLENALLTQKEKLFLDLLINIQMKKTKSQSLIENVQRQATFVDKMHDHLWIRSPAVEGTLRRSLDRYDKFVKLFQLYPNKMLVPTLDIDLVWHTHQCSAAHYEESMLERTDRYINHDDKIGQQTLHGGMDETKQLFRIRFGEDYSPCLCWDCETILTALENLEKEDNLFQEGSMEPLTKHVQNYVQYYRAAEFARRLSIDPKGIRV